jgi:hypothetical protein
VDSRPAISTRLDVKLEISSSVTWSSPDFDQKVPRSWSLVLHRLTTMSIMGIIAMRREDVVGLRLVSDPVT